MYMFNHYRCSEQLSRVAAYDLLVELCTDCYDNLVLVVRQLASMHHQENPQLAKEWEVLTTSVRHNVSR